jgi:hypothetical protein
MLERIRQIRQPVVARWPRLVFGVTRVTAQDMGSFVEPGGLARSTLVWASPTVRHAPRWDGARFLARCGGFWDGFLYALGMTVGLWGWRAAPRATRGDPGDPEQARNEKLLGGSLLLCRHICHFRHFAFFWLAF